MARIAIITALIVLGCTQPTGPVIPSETVEAAPAEEQQETTKEPQAEPEEEPEAEPLPVQSWQRLAWSVCVVETESDTLVNHYATDESNHDARCRHARDRAEMLSRGGVQHHAECYRETAPGYAVSL